MRGSPRIAVAAAVCLVVAACGGEDPGTSADGDRTPVTDGAFRMAITGDPGNLDPQLTVLALTRWVTMFMYDSLVSFGDGGEALPYLAESWEADLTTVTYTLKEGITCSDGSPLSASDVADNIAFIADPDNASPQLGVWVQPGVTATADDAARTVTVTSPQPDPFLLQGTGQMQIVCRAGLDDRSQLEGGSVGTGMFTLTESVAGDHYTFARRDEHAWGPGAGTAADPGVPQTVTLRVVTNESTAANLFLAGDLDAVNLTGPDLDRVEASGAPHYETRGLAGVLWFNQGEGHPGADPAVRQALAQAADFTELMTVLTDGRGATPTSLGVLEPRACTADTVSDHLPQRDAGAAAAALDAAGWLAGPDGVRAKDGEPLALSFIYIPSTLDGMAPAAELIAEQWGEIGAEVNLRSITNTEVNEILFGTGAWDAGFIQLNVAFPSQLVAFFAGPVPPDGTNFAHIANSEYASLVEQAAQLPVEEGCPLWEEAEGALITVSDVVPFASNPTRTYLDGVEGTVSAGSIVPATLRLYQ